MLELLDYTFFRNAIAGSVLAAVVCAMVGTYIVTRRLVFISGGITHASFGGIGIGLYTGISPMLSAAVFSVLSAFGINWLSRKGDIREDSAIAVLWTLGMALGIFFSYLTPGYVPDLSTYLFGNILTITYADLVMLGIVAAATAVFFACCLNSIIAISFDEEFARASGIRTAFIGNIMTALTALSVVACLRIVGIVLVLSLLTIPQMTAAVFTGRYRVIMILSGIFGLAGCLGGLALSFALNIPSGAAVIFVLTAVYLAAIASRHAKKRFCTIKRQ